jgi:hypothetical protein
MVRRPDSRCSIRTGACPGTRRRASSRPSTRTTKTIKRHGGVLGEPLDDGATAWKTGVRLTQARAGTRARFLPSRGTGPALAAARVTD